MKRIVCHPAVCALPLVALLALSLTGCGLRRSFSSSSAVRFNSLVIGTNLNAQPEALEVVQAEVMRFADNYAARVAQAVDDYNQGSVTPEARLEAVRWKLGVATAAFVDASGPNPALNALDLVVLATTSRMVMEDEISRIFGPDGLAMLETHRKLETNAWNSVQGILKPEQKQQLSTFIDTWRRKNPNQRYVAMTRFRELAVAIGRMPQSTGNSPNSLLGWIYLDPFAGLDPTASAIQETRQMAERGMYYAQRMPMLLNWQIQLLTLQVAAQPESRQVLNDADRISKSTEVFAEVAKQLPPLVNDQREAAIKQILAGLAVERTNWLTSLNAEQQKTSALLVDAKQTLNAASEAANSVNGAVKSLDEFVRYVSPPNTNPAPASTNRHPFNVLDYGTAASQIGAAAKDLNTTLLTLNQSTPELIKATTEQADRMVTRAFYLGLVLILVLLVGAVLAGLCYRWLANRMGNKGGGTSVNNPQDQA